MVILALVAYADIEDGYEALGAGVPGMFALAHALLVLAVAARASYVVQRFAADPPPPWLLEEDRRQLARRPRAWRIWRVLAFLSVVPIIVIGSPDWPAWTAFACWALLYSAIAAVVIVAVTLTWRGRWSLLTYLDPIKFGIAKLRVAERENHAELVDDLLETVGRRIARTSPRRPLHTGLTELRQAALLTRYRMRGERAHLDEAIALGRSLLTSRPHRKDPGRITRRMQLSSALHLAYQRTGDLRWLDEAIRMLRGVVADVPADLPLATAATANLAIVLLEHAVETGDTEEIRESIALQRRAIDETPVEDYRTVLVGSLPALLSPRSARSARHAVGNAMINAHYLPHRLVNLGSALLFLHHADEEPATLAEAEEVLRCALVTMPPEHIQRFWALRQLADALLVKHRLGDEAALDEAAKLLREALGILPAGHPDAGPMHYLLGEAAQRRGSRQDAIDHWCAAARLSTVTPEVRTAAAHRWGAAAADAADWAQALDGYGLAVELLGRLAARSLTRADQERLLSGPAGIVRDAAACALAAGEAERAVELLELGRGVLLGQALDTRSDIGLLHERHPELAREFVRIRDSFDQSPTSQGGIDPIVQRHALAEEWENVLAAIRDIDEFREFLRPRDALTLAQVAGRDAIVMVNISGYRCDALVLSDGAVRAVPLPEVTEDEVAGHAAAYFAAAAAATDPERTLRERATAEAEIRGQLAWLGEAITGPALARLPGGVSRVWWVPSGAAAYLPLHAADSVMDSTVSSYTPTIRVLEHARAQAAAGMPEEALVVSVAAPDGYDALPGTAAEVEAVKRRLGRVRELTGAQATRSAVLAALADAPLVHFACHAYGDVAAVSAGRLVLHDEPLSVLDINRLRIRDGRLAFLSACTTAQPSLALLDEAIHLSSAFQLAGYAHVIGTLWPAADDTAVAVAEAFYGNTARGLAPHKALHEAVVSLLAENRMTPSLWASYIHVGP
ncbi:CHAT domain-containing protein [Nonomuraea soli]|uniref:Tetratricopeptide (TPR) repeat protein n=1 Tax=Nonomuraea soli TaxID=1032476 RepID=A0A7W0HP51_9ACTN|nr:CHAT domain-containing protein [Nonomuraea soli]MBA2890500.1 tetratricopeptide (TPR) repeat protein [Nonomuraea soli]